MIYVVCWQNRPEMKGTHLYLKDKGRSPPTKVSSVNAADLLEDLEEAWRLADAWPNYAGSSHLRAAVFSVKLAPHLTPAPRPQ